MENSTDWTDQPNRSCFYLTRFLIFPKETENHFNYQLCAKCTFIHHSHRWKMWADVQILGKAIPFSRKIDECQVRIDCFTQLI